LSRGSDRLEQPRVERIQGKRQHLPQAAGGDARLVHAFDIAVEHGRKIAKKVVEMPLKERPRCHGRHRSGKDVKGALTL
jgi:hypothetical protein